VQNSKEENAMNNGWTFVSYVLAAAASICFIGGMAVLSGGKEK
jgi:hypothetical protein